MSPRLLHTFFTISYVPFSPSLTYFFTSFLNFSNGVFKLSVIQKLINKEVLPCKTALNKICQPALHWVLQYLSGVHWIKWKSQFLSSTSITVWAPGTEISTEVPGWRLRLISWFLSVRSPLQKTFFSEGWCKRRDDIHQEWMTTADLVGLKTSLSSTSYSIKKKVSSPLFSLEDKIKRWHRRRQQQEIIRYSHEVECV